LFIFTWFFIPETRDRTLEEVHEMFEARVPARKFKNYVCTGVESYAAEAIGGDALKRDEKTGAVRVETDTVGSKDV
jgi:hypothetical protein